MTMVFIGINQAGVIEAAVCAESLAAAKALLAGLQVIKMTSKTRLFVTAPGMPANKKVMLSGATKRVKGASLPTAVVTVINGRIEFLATVYINNEPARDLMYLQFASTPGAPSQLKVCE